MVERGEARLADLPKNEEECLFILRKIWKRDERRVGEGERGEEADVRSGRRKGKP